MPAAAAITSRSMTLPLGPLGATLSRTIPFSLARFLALGEAPWALLAVTTGALSTTASLATTATSSTDSVADSSPARSSGVETFSPASPTLIMGYMTGTSSPSWYHSLRTVPSAVDSTSMVDLSVSASQTISPTLILSPSFTFHSRMIHDSTVFPCFGINTSLAILTPCLNNHDFYVHGPYLFYSRLGQPTIGD